MAIATGKGGSRTATTAAPIPVFNEPVRGQFPDPRLRMLTGQDQRRAGLAGRWPKPPMAHLTGMEFSRANDDGVTWEQPISPWFLTSEGVVPGGFLAAVTDAALSSATSLRLPPRTVSSTSEIAIDFLKAITLESGTLVAYGRQVHANDRLALSECTVWDATGAPVIHATSRSMLEPATAMPEGAWDLDAPGAVDAFIDSLPRMEEPAYPTPDPYRRPKVGEVLPPSTWKRLTGRVVLDRQITGKLPMPPIHYLTGMRPTATGNGEATFAMPASGWFTSGLGSIQGGFLAMMAYSSLASAIQTTVDTHTGHVPIDLRVNFLRPVFPDSDGGELIAHGMVIHRGRNLAVAEAEILDPDGKPVAVASGTQLLLPGHPASSFV